MSEHIVMAVHPWPTNAYLIEDVARLGYLRREWRTADVTYGRGVWWKRWRPDELVASDLDPKKSPTGTSVDFTALPYADASFQAIALDAPYKLNGTPTPAIDERFGVHEYRPRAARHQLLLDGITECARVLAPEGTLLVKVQNQVNGGRVRWQTDIAGRHAETHGLEKIDEFHMLSYRPQPAGRDQQHARRNHSTLQVFTKPKPRRRAVPDLGTAASPG